MIGYSRAWVLVTAAFLATAACSAGAPEATASSELNLSHVSYDSVLNLEGAALKTALNALVNNQHAVGYNAARKIIFNDPAFLAADGLVECNYTGREVAPNGSSGP